ncbi:MAG: hypothetical protein HY877_04665 [Deltaproteobacteria bacterium]|nr:hypothetical protein [Deltaproteobacteria bacterium]
MIKNKRKQESLGELELRSIAYVQFRKKEFLRVGDLVEGIGLSKSQEYALLFRLETKGQIVRIKRGIYYVPPQLPPSGRISVSEYFILSKYMEIEKATYQVSGPSAFHRYGFDEQIPNILYIYNDRISEGKTIGGYRFIFIRTSKERLKGSNLLKDASGVSVYIASKPKALVDAVYDWSRFNTLPRAFSWIVAATKKDKRLATQIVNAVVDSGNIAVARRIGCLLMHNGFSKQSLRKLKDSLGGALSLIPLVPRKPARGATDKYWGIIINDTIEF